MSQLPIKQEPSEEGVSNVGTRYVSMLGNQVRWFPAMDSDERIAREHEAWTQRFKTLYPPVVKGTYKVELGDVISSDTENRYPLIGGPMDGQGWAKEIKIKKGRGKSALEVRFHNAPEEIRITQGDVTGFYYAWFDQDGNILEFHWNNETKSEEQENPYLLGPQPSDPYNEEYWENYQESLDTERNA